MIEIKNVSKWFGDFQVLTDVNETIERGQTMVICGPSGSGKSTLLRCVNGLEPYQEGEIIVDGVSLSDPKTNLYKLRENIGMVFQRFELYPHMTALQNITLAPMKVRKWSKQKAGQKAMELLERVGIPDKADAYPANLSGGQQQRVAIARALANDPPILIADEPTGNLDTQTAEAITQLFVELVAQGKTLLMVTHDQDLTRFANRTLMVADGQITNGPILPTKTQLQLEVGYAN
jgi:ABC-type polar amino acid transport system ATPase subunit